MTATSEQLKDRDYVLILDKSGSMSERDCPGGKTRWETAQESTMALANKTQAYDPDGITVVPFASTFKIYESTTPAKVADVFKENEPIGGTILGPVLNAVFQSYLDRKKSGNAKKNGEICLVITDGCPSDEPQVVNEIIKFAGKLDSDEEYGISFLQVGRDQHAHEFLKRLDDNLTKEGAKFDIVNAKTMEELETVGITEALLASLND